MKIIRTYTVLLASLGYFILGMHPSRELPSTQIEQDCSIETKAAKQTHTCCEDEQIENAPQAPCHDNENESDCCGQTGCSLTCCHIAVASVPTPGEFNYFLASISRSFMDLGHDNLPEPYIGRIYPPPNALPA